MNKTRPNKVIFRMSDEKLKLLNQRVKEFGMTKQDWILSVLLLCLNSGNIIKNYKVIDTYSKKLNIYGRTIGEEVLSKYKYERWQYCHLVMYSRHRRTCNVDLYRTGS